MSENYSSKGEKRTLLKICLHRDFVGIFGSIKGILLGTVIAEGVDCFVAAPEVNERYFEAFLYKIFWVGIEACSHKFINGVGQIPWFVECRSAHYAQCQ